MITPANKKQGVAILFAVLMVSVILSISLVLFNITYKQILLSSIIRESQLSFYAADSALNCARHGNSFHSASNPLGYFTTVDGLPVWNQPGSTVPVCGSSNITMGDFTPVLPYQVGKKFTVTFDFASRTTCANVSVSKNNVSPTLGTLIEVQGYNNGNSATCPAPGNRTVERAIRFGPF